MARMRYGVYHELEDQADELIRQSLVGVTKHSEKSDLLTPWKMADRHRREVMVSSGTPDIAVRSGMFHRVANRGRPDLNSRDGLARANRMSSGPTTRNGLGRENDSAE